MDKLVCTTEEEIAALKFSLEVAQKEISRLTSQITDVQAAEKEARMWQGRFLRAAMYIVDGRADREIGW